MGGNDGNDFVSLSASHKVQRYSISIVKYCTKYIDRYWGIGEIGDWDWERSFSNPVTFYRKKHFTNPQFTCMHTQREGVLHINIFITYGLGVIFTDSNYTAIPTLALSLFIIGITVEYEYLRT